MPVTICVDLRNLWIPLSARLLNLVLERSGPQRADADDAQDDQR